MWRADGEKLYMSEGDYGNELPFAVKGFTVNPDDSLRFEFKTATNGELLFEKVFTDVVDNTVRLVLTKAESDLLTPGTYAYSLAWYQSGHFNCYIVEDGRFKVGDVA